MRSGSPLIVALDFGTADAAWQLVQHLDARLCRVKVGKELFTASGPELVRGLVARGFDVFLDLKFHDIPNTVAAAVRAAASLGVWMVNVHASGGRRMMEAAVAAVLGVPGPRPLLTAVTVLTSFAAEDLVEIGVPVAIDDQVLRLTRLAMNAGMDGVVCSAREARMIREQLGAKPLLVTPGIRPLAMPVDDQKRSVTPREAMAAGSDYLVVGRPITASPDPSRALQSIMSEMSYSFS